MTSLEEGLLSGEEKFSSIFILVLSFVLEFAVKNFVFHFERARLRENKWLSYFYFSHFHKYKYDRWGENRKQKKIFFCSLLMGL
tara:strand:- start:1327 stop:1578 length:252 start_codon:yes stop_codon:yes gene_type:complete